MPAVVEIRFRIRDNGEFKRQLNENKKETDAVIANIKAAGKQVGSGLVLPLRDARKVLVDLGGDTKRFETALRQAGVSIRDAKLLTSQLNKELNASRREVMGMGTETGKFVKGIRDGVFAAQAMAATFEKAKQALESMKKLGKVKGLEESTADALELEKAYSRLQAKLGMSKDAGTFARVRKNIADASIEHNVPQASLIEATLKAQETKSAGRELALDNGGALLKRFAKASYGDFMEASELPDFINSQVIQMKNFGIGGDAGLNNMQGIIRAGEEKGALSAKNIATKGGGVMAQLAALQGTSGELAVRRGQAFLQTIADAPGIDGDIDVAKNRAENLIAKLADPATRKRIKESAGFDTFQKDGKTMRPIGEIMSGFLRAEAEGKIKLPKTDQELDEAMADPKKKLKYGAYYEIWKDMQAREGFLAVRKGKDKLRELENVDPNVGQKFFQEGYDQRMQSYEGQLGRIARRDEETHFQKLGEKFPWIRAAAQITSQAQADSPLASGLVDTAASAAGFFGPQAQMMTALAGSSLIMAGTGANLKIGKNDPRNKMFQAAHDQNMSQSQERVRLSTYQTASLEKQIEETKKKLADAEAKARDYGVNLKVVVETGMKATVTQEAKSNSSAAKSGTRTQRKPGQR